VQYSGTKLLLLHSLFRVHDEGTPAFYRALYADLPESHPDWQLAALAGTYNYQYRESLTLFTDLILAKTPKATYEQSLFYSLPDSLNNSKVMFPRIMALHAIPEYADNLYWLTNELYKKNILAKEELASYRKPLLRDAEARLARHLQTKKEDENYYSDEYTLLSLTEVLGNFTDDKECITLLNQIMTSSSDEPALTAGIALLKQNKPVDKKRIGAIAANRSLRIKLYDELTSLKKQELFPKKYLTQAYFAEASLVSYLLMDEEGGEPDKIVLLETREKEYKGKKGRVYVYKLMYKDADGAKDTWYVAVSGLQPLNKKQVSSDGQLTYTTWSTLEEKSIEQHYQELTQ
jgi:hypothetical protein